MKSNPNKLLIIVITVVICSVLTVTGLAASAASHHNPAFDTPLSTVSAQNDSESEPALKDGVWKAEYTNGNVCYFIINSKENSFTILNEDKSMGVPSRYEYDESTGVYQLHIGSVDNIEHWQVIDNTGDTAFVTTGNSELITLTYLSENTEI